MGLTGDDITAITRGWLETMTAAQAAMVAGGGYTWSLMPGQANANASPVTLSQASCLPTLRAACNASEAEPYAHVPLVMGVTPVVHSGTPLPDVSQDVAGFLLLRGPHAYLGYGVWGMSWPTGSSFDTTGGPALPLPAAMKAAYGTPVGRCTEVAGRPGVFTRAWSSGAVVLDCNTWTAELP